MNILAELRSRFAPVLTEMAGDAAPLLEMIRAATDSKFGDYQANFAMPLAKKLGKSPRDIATEVAARVQLEDICDPPEIAGPGFINLRLKNEFIEKQLNAAIRDERLGVPLASPAKTYIVDYSSPNVAKPMHVGHIRSTVIGDSLCRTLKFLGHKVISDNHLGDWGTQFGMIIYGWKHFGDKEAYHTQPVAELARVYRLVRRLMDYFEAQEQLPALKEKVSALEAELARRHAEHPDIETIADKKVAKELRKLDRDVDEKRNELKALTKKLEASHADDSFSALIHHHTHIASAVLEETAKLHAGDEENRQLWADFLPNCRKDIQRIYDRLNVKFDLELGESFYEEKLPEVVHDLVSKNLAVESQGAMCVFVDGFETPMIVQKKDGAFLYATTDLATIQYRMAEFKPDAILYVVDHRQSEHFDKLFAVAKKWSFENVEFKHVKFGTVLGDDGRPFKTRAGDTVGLESLLDDAVAKAAEVVAELDEMKKEGPQLSPEQRQQVAWVIGHAAIKYADLSQNRESDYTFSFDKMVALKGNTATYMQYANARLVGIFAKGEVDRESLRIAGERIKLGESHERALGLMLAKFPETLTDAMNDYRPNLLTDYLYNLSGELTAFYEHCQVLNSGDAEASRLLLCDLAARTISRGLDLLGIETVQRM